MNSNLALSSLTAQIPQEAPGNYKMSKVNDKAELTKSYIGDGSVVEKKGSEKSEGEVSKSIWAIIVWTDHFLKRGFLNFDQNLFEDRRCQWSF